MFHSVLMSLSFANEDSLVIVVCFISVQSCAFLCRWWQMCDMWLVRSSLHIGPDMWWVQLRIIPGSLCHLWGTWSFRCLLLQRVYHHGKRRKTMCLYLCGICASILIDVSMLMCENTGQKNEYKIMELSLQHYHPKIHCTAYCQHAPWACTCMCVWNFHNKKDVFGCYSSWDMKCNIHL